MDLLGGRIFVLIDEILRDERVPLRQANLVEVLHHQLVALFRDPGVDKAVFSDDADKTHEARFIFGLPSDKKKRP